MKKMMMLEGMLLRHAVFDCVWILEGDYARVVDSSYSDGDYYW